MIRTLVLSFLGCAVFASFGFAAGPGSGLVGAAPIGIAMGTGIFTLDSTPVTGPIDLANGTELHTTVTPSDVHLENGVEIRLATRSTGTLFQDRMILNNGALKLNHFDGYPVQAGGLTIQADSFDAEAIIRTTPKTIEIASIGGTVSVRDAGAMMTRVAAGTKMAFQNSGATAGGQNQTPAQTGAAPAPAEKGPMSDKKAILWAAGICAVGAIVVGSIAASQGKSPF
jgi:hypothetical protein